MSIIQSVKNTIGIGKTQAEQLEEDMRELSETYPDTPDMTFRCCDCEEVKDVLKARGSVVLGSDKPGGKVGVICEDCE